MFSGFKSRGFGLMQSQIQKPDRMERLILIMGLALYWTVQKSPPSLRPPFLSHCCHLQYGDQLKWVMQEVYYVVGDFDGWQEAAQKSLHPPQTGSRTMPLLNEELLPSSPTIGKERRVLQMTRGGAAR